MKYIKYTKFTGEDLGIDAQDLLQALSDFLLQSGFNDPYNPTGQWREQSMEELKRAIEQALMDGKLFPDDRQQELMDRLEAMSGEQMEKLVDQLIQKLEEDGSISKEGEPGRRAGR